MTDGFEVRSAPGRGRHLSCASESVGAPAGARNPLADFGGTRTQRKDDRTERLSAELSTRRMARGNAVKRCEEVHRCGSQRAFSAISWYNGETNGIYGTTHAPRSCPRGLTPTWYHGELIRCRKTTTTAILLYRQEPQDRRSARRLPRRGLDGNRRQERRTSPSRRAATTAFWNGNTVSNIIDTPATSELPLK